MKKNLLLLLSLVFCVTVSAKVSLDFTNAVSEWGFPSGSSAGAAIVGTETSYTNGTYTVYLYGASGNGCYANSGYIMVCNSGSYIKLQGFDFAVGTIVVGGHSGGSSTATMNIYVGETAVSTECTDCSVDHTFEIAADYQTANTEYICMNTSSKNYQVTTIDIYEVGEEIGDDTPTGHGYEPDNPYTCEEAIEIISALASGGTVKDIYVKGIVSTIGSYNSNYGELIYYISDDGTTNNQLEIYDGYYLNNEKFTSDYANELMVGDEVIVYGTFTNYNGNTPEGSMGATYIYSLTRSGESVEPGTGGDTPTGHGFGPDDPYTASEAIEIAKELDSSTTISGVYVTGIISQIDEISTSFGNATYYISDDGTTDNQLEIYRGYYLDGARFTSEDQIKVSDTVVVYGDLVDYSGNTPELTTGNKIYSINGSTEAPDEGGDGGDGNDDYPYTGEVTRSGSTVTLTNPDVSVGTETAYIDFSTFGFSNSHDVSDTPLAFDDGSTVVFKKGEDSNNPPAYYTSGTSIRVYYNNTMTFTCDQQIAKIEMQTYSSTYNGSSTATVSFSDTGAFYCNVKDSNNTQLRVQNITIYYAGEGGDEEPEPEPEPEVVIGGLETFENGSFEEWDTDGYPVGWHSTTTASSSGRVSQSTDCYEGQYAVQIAHSSSSNYRLGSKEYLLPAGTYAISFYAKPAEEEVYPIIEFGYAPWDSEKDAMGTYVYLQFDGEQKITIDSDEWTNITGEFTLDTETQVNLVVMCHQNGAGAVLVDLYTIEALTGAFTISSAGYATYYTADEYTMPEGVVGTTVTGVESQATDGGYILDMAWGYEAGATVPAGTALVLKGEAATYTYTITATGAAAVEDNLLLGAVEDTTTYGPLADEDYFFYELTNGENGIGFYWANADGSAFTSAARKAWLPLTTAQAYGAKFLGFGEDDGTTTGITAVASSAADSDAIYTLQGVRVADMTKKGIYIVGGRKVLVK